MEKESLVYKNPNGKYLLVENKKIDVLLVHLIGMLRKTVIRYAFYLSFLITLFSFFLFYLIFLPQEALTTIYISLSLFSFALGVSIVELIKSMHQKSFLRKILDAH